MVHSRINTACRRIASTLTGSDISWCKLPTNKSDVTSCSILASFFLDWCCIMLWLTVHSSSTFQQQHRIPSKLPKREELHTKYQSLPESDLFLMHNGKLFQRLDVEFVIKLNNTTCTAFVVDLLLAVLLLLLLPIQQPPICKTPML